MSGPKNALADKGAANEPPPMPDGKVDLPSGGYAILQTKPNHAEYKRLFKAIAGTMDTALGDKLDFMADVVSTLLLETTGTDRDGKALGRSLEDMGRWPHDDFIVVYDVCAAIFKAIKRPNT